jgi:hypothetical protein
MRLFAAVLAVGMLACPNDLLGQLSVEIPRSGVTVDGRFAPEEWAGSVERTLADSSRVLLRHDGSFLYVGIRSRAAGFPSICAVRQDTVRILHSSAALATGTYVGPMTASRLVIPFGRFVLRGRDTSAGRRAEQKSFLEANHWIANNSAMSDREWETQIAISLFDEENPRIALGFYRATSDDSISWPASLRDSCTSLRTVQGFLSTTAASFIVAE